MYKIPNPVERDISIVKSGINERVYNEILNITLTIIYRPREMWERLESSVPDFEDFMLDITEMSYIYKILGSKEI
jgi:hypothetical protein